MSGKRFSLGKAFGLIHTKGKHKNKNNDENQINEAEPGAVNQIQVNENQDNAEALIGAQPRQRMRNIVADVVARRNRRAYQEAGAYEEKLDSISFI